MASFAKVAKGKTAPGRTLVLEPWVFAEEWSGRPKAAVCVGLRIVADGDKSKARAEAERLADELHPTRGENWLDAFNDALVRQLVALGVCSPNDVNQPAEILPFAEERVRFALTPLGAAFINNAIVRYEVESSPLSQMADGEDLTELRELLEAVPAASMRPGLRRLAYCLLEELRELDAR